MTPSNPLPELCIHPLSNGDRSPAGTMGQVDVFTKNGELEPLRSLWDQWQSHPNVDFDFYRLINNIRDHVIAPFVLRVRTEDSTVALLVGRIEHSTLPLEFGYFKTSAFKLRSLEFIYGGEMGSISDETAIEVFACLENIFKSVAVDRISFHGIKTSSPILAQWRQRSRLRRNWSLTETPHRRMALPSDKGEVLSNLKSKHRSWIRRNQKRLNEKFGDVRFESFSSVDQCGSLAEEVERVARKTYQRGLGAGFVNSAENRKRLELAAEKQQLRAYLLYANGAPVAFWIGYVSNHVFHSSATGYDPAFKEFEVGTLILVRLLEALVEEGVTYVDFGLGDALYKQRFGTEGWLESSFCLYSNTAKGKFLNCLSAAVWALNQTARRGLARLRMTDRIKKAWRTRLISTAPIRE